jgi:hypothetical protein
MTNGMLTVTIDSISERLLEARDLAKKARSQRPKKLSASGAMALHVADVTVAKLKAAAKLAEETRALIQERYRASIPLSEDPKEAAGGIRAAEVGGISVRVTPVDGSERFSLKDYREAGHEVTPEMRDAISTSKPFERWTVKDVRGPRRADAVELNTAS